MFLFLGAEFPGCIFERVSVLCLVLNVATPADPCGEKDNFYADFGRGESFGKVQVRIFLAAGEGL